MEPTIFFLFFLVGIVPIIFGMKEKIPGIIFLGGMIFFGLFLAVFIEGFTISQVSNKLITYGYYSLYGNGTINMTANQSIAYSYADSTIKNNFTSILAWVCLGLGLTGVLGAFYYWKGEQGIG